MKSSKCDLDCTCSVLGLYRYSVYSAVYSPAYVINRPPVYERKREQWEKLVAGVSQTVVSGSCDVPLTLTNRER